MGAAWLGGGVTHYCLRPVPALALLSMRRDSYFFQDENKQEIITELLLDYSQLCFDFDLTQTQAKRATCIQYRENYLAFPPCPLCLLVQEDLSFRIEHK